MSESIDLITHELNKTQKHPGAVEKFHGPECFAMLSQLGLASTAQIESMLAVDKAGARRNKYMEGLARVVFAKMAALEGNFRLAKSLFDQAFKKKVQLNRESAKESGEAYLNLEYAEMLALAGDMPGYERYLDSVRNLAKSNKLKHIIEYMLHKQDLDNLQNLNLRNWLQHVAYFNKYDMSFMEVVTKFGLAEHYIRHEKLEDAQAVLEEALQMAQSHHYQYYQLRITLKLAEILVLVGALEPAREQLLALLDSVSSGYMKLKIHIQLSDILDRQNDQQFRLTKIKEAVELAQRFGVLQEIARAADIAGLLYHRENADMVKAFFYYQKAYGAITDLLGLGFAIQGEMASILDRYVTFLEEHFPGEVEEAANEDLFAYSNDLEWVRIKDLFHYNLFLYHYMHTGVGARTLEVLDFPASSFYSATERLRSRGIQFPNFRKSKVDIPAENYIEGLQQYCRMHREKTWEAVNERFEKDMLTYQYKLNNYNKKVMAKKLGLAYSGIVNRTQYLTSGKN